MSDELKQMGDLQIQKPVFEIKQEQDFENKVEELNVQQFQQVEQQKEIEDDDFVIEGLQEEKLEQKRETVKVNMPPHFKNAKFKKGKKGKSVPYFVHKARRRQQMKNEHKAKYENPAYASLLSSMNTFEKNEDFKVLNTPNLEKMKEEHEIKTRTVIKEHMFKKDEVITEVVVEDKAEKVARKGAVAKRLTALSKESIERKTKMRRNTPLDTKKYMDYNTFRDVSEFTDIFKEDEMHDFLKLYSNGEKYKKVAKNNKDPKIGEQHYKEDTIPAMNMLTGKIMSMDPFGYDLTSDESIARNADKLESMSHAVSAYRRLLDKNPDYIKYLSTQKTEKGANMAVHMMTHLDRLTAVGQYYRLRKVVIEDELYSSHANEEITMDEKPGDSTQMKRLKKLMRASYQAGINMNRILGDVDIPDMKWEGEKSSDMDKLAMLPMIKHNIEANDADPIEKIKIRLKEQASRDSAVSQLESERFFQAPIWMSEALTIDTSKLKTKNPHKTAGYGNGNSVTDIPMLTSHLKATGKKELFDKRAKLHTVEGRIWGNKTNFEGGKDAYLGNMEVSDDWNRIEYSFADAYAYKLTDEEVLEMTELMAVQQKKDWNKIALDPDAKAYYESAYKEMAMKLIFSAYAGCRRMAETIGGKFLSINSVDLALQTSRKLRSEIFQFSTVTNINTEKNMPLIKKLFDENNVQGRYAFDLQDFDDYSSVTGSMNFRMNNVGTAYVNLVTKFDEEEKIEVMFGSQNFFNETILPEYKDYMKKNKKNPERWGINNEDSIKQIASWYFAHHPEYFTKEYMTKKYNGEYIIQDQITEGFRGYMAGNEKGIRNCIKKGKIDMPSMKELDDYEKYLKENGYPPTRIALDFSLGEAADIDPEEKISYDDTDEKIKKEIVIENIKKDPYGLNLMRTGLDELVYTKKDGTKVLRSGIGNI